MKTYRKAARGRRAPRLATLGAAAAMVAALSGCDSLLDVENPNNVVQEALEDAGSVNALVNGALARTSQAVSAALLTSATVTDEYTWVGSQNAMGEIERGELRNTANSYSPFLNLAESRWLSDQAVTQAEVFRSELPRPEDLSRAYLYSGINYLTVADFFDDFAFSDRTEAQPPVGPSNMVTVYDQAIDRFTSARQEAQQLGEGDLEVAALAMRARAHYAKAMWNKLKPSVASDPWIDDGQANADAQAVLAMTAGQPDWRYTFEYSSATVSNSAASNANSRLEVRVNERFGTVSSNGKRIDEVTFTDILDTDVVSPVLERRINEFVDGFQYSPLVLTNAREMHLILAEAGHASGNQAQAVEHINAVRALDGLTPYDPVTHSVGVDEMLKHSRLVNLFLMPQRRWADMYRFGEETSEWSSGADTRSAPGTFFPIHQDEELSNCHILGTC